MREKESLKCSTWVLSQKQQNDLGSFPRQTIQYHSNLTSRNWSWIVLWRRTRHPRKVKVTQSCLILCNTMDYTVHGILQMRTLEWVDFPSSRGSSWPRNQTGISWFAGGFFTSWVMREAPVFSSLIYPQPERTWPQGHAWLPKEYICFILILSSSFCIKLIM